MSCWPAATRWASSSSTAARCGRCCGACEPTSFEDIVAVDALYRPGPMGANAHNEYADRKTSRKPVTPIHPELAEPLAEILGDTYGLIVYQEQVMAIAQKLAGYTPGKADLLRRAMGKKKKEILDKEFEPFAAGMKANGYTDSADQGDLGRPGPVLRLRVQQGAQRRLRRWSSYWTAYLKANYPAEYMAALLTSVSGDKDKSALYLNECRRMGITVLPPDVNASAATFTPVGGDIRFGLAAVRNVGTNVVDAIVAARSAKGAFTSFADFLRKVPVNVCNKRVIESLVKAGAFDSLGHPRKGLVLIHEQAIDTVIDVKRNEAMGQDSLFGGDAEIEAIVRGPGARRGMGQVHPARVRAGDARPVRVRPPAARDRAHPVRRHRLLGRPAARLRRRRCRARSPGRARRCGSRSPWAGSCPGCSARSPGRAMPWAAATLEDLEGAIEVLFFPATYAECATLLADDAIVVVKGRLDRRDDSPKLVAREVTVPDLSVGPSGPFVVSLPVQRCVRAGGGPAPGGAA